MKQEALETKIASCHFYGKQKIIKLLDSFQSVIMVIWKLASSMPW